MMFYIYICIYIYMYIYVRRIRRYLGRKQWSSMLTAAYWSRGFRRPPPSGFTKGMSVNFQGGGFFTCLPDPSSDEQLTPFTFLSGRELALAALCFKRRSMASVASI